MITYHTPVHSIGYTYVLWSARGPHILRLNAITTGKQKMYGHMTYSLGKMGIVGYPDGGHLGF